MQGTMENHIVTALNRLVEHYGPQNWWQSENKVEDLVSMVLIQRTTERNAKLALRNLEEYLTLESLLDLSLEDLQEKIRPAGFFSSKSQTIKNLLQFVQDGGGFSGFACLSTAELRRRLLSLKGIGPETADVILLYIFDRKVFIADEYAHRFFERMKFGTFVGYDQLKTATANLTELADLATCREWHAVIDQHGKEFRRLKGDMDESWLLK